MLCPQLFSLHKKIINEAFCIMEQKDNGNVALVRLYGIDGIRISGLIISNDFNYQYIDVAQQGEWYNWFDQ